MTRKEREQLRYRYVRNLTGDAKLAQQARGWGQERILKELGIVLPDSKPKLQTLTKERKERLRQLQENKKKYAVRKGLDADDARLYSLNTYKEIEREVRYREKYKLKGKLGSADKGVRMDTWSEWGKEDAYPPSLSRNARLVNLRKGLDINASYGFAIMYYAFTTNKSPEHYMNQFDADKNTGMIIYKTTVKM